MDNQKLYKYLWVIPGLVFVAAVVVIGLSVYQKQNSGLVEVSSVDQTADIYILQPNKTASYAGRGYAKVRLSSGNYIFIGSNGTEKSVVTAYVENNDVTYVKIPGLNNYTLPTQEAINFNGMDYLVDRGWTTDEINSLKRYFFYFKKQAGAVDILSSSIIVTPRSRYSASDEVETSFTVTVDNKTYSAKATRSLSDTSVSLKLYDENGGLVYSSASISNTGD